MPANSINVRLFQSGPIPLDIDIECQPSEIFVLVGPSGSGKTTTLRSIAGLYQPSSGKILCGDQLWFDSDTGSNIPVQKRATGFVFQHYALFPHLTVQDNIRIAIKDRQKLHSLSELISLTRLQGLEQRYPHQLSGGQQQRVALARALACSPEVLLLDEPFSAIDQQTRRHLVRELVQLKTRINIPVIHVTHNLNEARRLADKLCIISQGKSLQTGSADTIMNRPVSAEVARLTGHDNAYTATVCAQDAQAGKSWIDWQGIKLQCDYQPEFSLNEKVDWFISSTQIALSHQESEAASRTNHLQATISEIIQLGEGTVVTLALPQTSEKLTLNISTYLSRQEQLATGQSVAVSLLASGIHLMKTSPIPT